MKNKIFFILPILISPLYISASSANQLFTVNFDVIGPFHIGDPDVSITGTVISEYDYSKIKERFSVGQIDGEYTYFELSAAHSVQKKKKYELTFNLPLQHMLTAKGLECKIDFYETTSNILYTNIFKIKPPSKRKLDIKSYTNKYYSEPYVLAKPGSDSPNNAEKIKFEGFIDYFNEDNYYRLSLNNLYALYSGLKNFPSSTGTLHLDDYNNAFPYLHINSNLPVFDVPIKATLKNGKITFSFAKTMYVNEKTLEMSLSKKPGFIVSPYFYLPINRAKDLLDQEFTLSFGSFGFGESIISWNMRYITTRYRIGDCQDSDFCIRGENV